MVARSCNTTTGRLREEGHEIETSLDYIVKPCLKKQRERERQREEKSEVPVFSGQNMVELESRVWAWQAIVFPFPLVLC
jgi:hypothetical protein